MIPPGSTEPVAVSIVLYKSDLGAFRHACHALSNQSHPVTAVAVWVNDPADLSVDVAGRITRECLPHVRAHIQAGEGNIGFAQAHNRNMRALFEHGADSVVIHNPDLFLSQDAIAHLLAAVHKVGDCALFGPLMLRADVVTFASEGVIDSAGIRWTRTARHLDDRQGESASSFSRVAPYRVSGISGACLLVPRRAHDLVVELTGEFFDEDFFAYREDAELGLRASLVGVPSWIVPRSQALHIRRQRGTTRSVSYEINRLSVRNRFLIAFKYGRARPGNVVSSVLRDIAVIGGVTLRERSSFAGLRSAWHLRQRMRLKGERIRAAVQD